LRPHVYTDSPECLPGLRFCQTGANIPENNCTAFWVPSAPAYGRSCPEPLAFQRCAATCRAHLCSADLVRQPMDFQVHPLRLWPSTMLIEGARPLCHEWKRQPGATGNDERIRVSEFLWIRGEVSRLRGYPAAPVTSRSSRRRDLQTGDAFDAPRENNIPTSSATRTFSINRSGLPPNSVRPNRPPCPLNRIHHSLAI